MRKKFIDYKRTNLFEKSTKKNDFVKINLVCPANDYKSVLKVREKIYFNDGL